MKRIISILCIACAVLGAQASDFCRKNADGKMYELKKHNLTL